MYQEECRDVSHLKCREAFLNGDILCLQPKTSRGFFGFFFWGVEGRDRGRVRNFIGGEKGKGSFSHNKDNGFASLPYSAMLHVLMHLKSNFEAMFERDKWNLSNRSNQH